MTVDTLSFEAGGGPVAGCGRIGIGPIPGRRAGLMIEEADLALRGTNVRSEFPDGFTSVSDLDLTFRFDSAGARLGGTIDLVKGIYSRNLKAGSVAVRGGSGLDLPPRSPLPDPPASPGLDIPVPAPQDGLLRHDPANLQGPGGRRVPGGPA